MGTGEPETDRASRRRLDTLCINTIRTLAMDAVQKADSGHPGTPMALAPLAYVLWLRHLRYNPRNPMWLNRDRFILSAGHACMLQYAVLHLTGYDLSLDDIRQFRQWDSKTPGHPEYGRTPGVETTTGPLGQGVMNSVGMAIAESHLAAVLNRPGLEIIDHHTYAICSDGDLMEGASHEAASLAGHLGLGKLIWIYDQNHISIEGPTEITYDDDVATRFQAYGWHVLDIGDRANDLEAIDRALAGAREERDRPSLVIVRSHIGYGAPDLQDDPEAHGSPLGEEEVKKTKEFYGWPPDKTFLVPDEVADHMRGAVDRGARLEREWNDLREKWRQAEPDLARQLDACMSGELLPGWDEGLPEWKPDDGPVATRNAAGDALRAIARKTPWLIGGSGDLAPSTKTLLKDTEYLARDCPEGRNIAYGVRELNMCGTSNGIALHGGLRPFAATFFIFTDYARPAIRLAALMELPVIYVMTHDSIGLGEDGPTHQPVEHLASLRAMPNLCVIRPADANEAVQAWRAAMARKEGPTMLVLTRQKLHVFDRSHLAPASGLLQGGYILSEAQKERPDVILIATGSEVQLVLEAQSELADEDVQARVVSMPSWELFEAQGDEYREAVLPGSVRARLAVEAGSPLGWERWVGDAGDVIGITTFGASAPYKENFKHYGFTVQHVVERAMRLVRRQK